MERLKVARLALICFYVIAEPSPLHLFPSQLFDVNNVHGAGI